MVLAELYTAARDDINALNIDATTIPANPLGKILMTNNGYARSYSSEVPSLNDSGNMATAHIPGITMRKTGSNFKMAVVRLPIFACNGVFAQRIRCTIKCCPHQ